MGWNAFSVDRLMIVLNVLIKILPVYKIINATAQIHYIILMKKAIV